MVTRGACCLQQQMGARHDLRNLSGKLPKPAAVIAEAVLKKRDP